MVMFMLQAIFYCGNRLVLPCLKTNLTPMSFLPDYVFPEFLFIFFITKGVSSSLVSVWAFACVFLLHFGLVFPKHAQTAKMK